MDDIIVYLCFGWHLETTGDVIKITKFFSEGGLISSGWLRNWVPKATQLLSLRAWKRSLHHNAALLPSPQRYLCFLILTDSWHFLKNSFSLKSIFDVVDFNQQLFMHLMLNAVSTLGRRGCLPCEQLLEMHLSSAVKMALYKGRFLHWGAACPQNGGIGKPVVTCQDHLGKIYLVDYWILYSWTGHPGIKFGT